MRGKLQQGSPSAVDPLVPLQMHSQSAQKLCNESMPQDLSGSWSGAGGGGSLSQAMQKLVGQNGQSRQDGACPAPKHRAALPGGTGDLFSNWAGVRGRIWVESQPPSAFFCQDSGDHPAWEGWVWFPTLARRDPGDTDLRGVGREKKDVGGTGWVEVYGSRAIGEWARHWFLYHTEDHPGGWWEQHCCGHLRFSSGFQEEAISGWSGGVSRCLRVESAHL